jgi:acyl carrier protein
MVFTHSTPTPRTAFSIGCQVLRVPAVGRDDNFFDLGGHSLGFVQVQLALNSALGIELPVVELFAHPTVRTLALAEIVCADSS